MQQESSSINQSISSLETEILNCRELKINAISSKIAEIDTWVNGGNSSDSIANKLRDIDDNLNRIELLNKLQTINERLSKLNQTIQVEDIDHLKSTLVLIDERKSLLLAQVLHLYYDFSTTKL